ncbi:MAG: hypothetical protein KVP17_002470 [Porospora cf. gigantea B]|uniref:uncharacterized protein n=1 Tax=Porospora cf. gigantea B TaxID=2853592 RepID=UPI003571D02E|nr:MAG: hypothetical protein KVP17_002470 [Porospora cf. gigantea B]
MFRTECYSNLLSSVDIIIGQASADVDLVVALIKPDVKPKDFPKDTPKVIKLDETSDVFKLQPLVDRVEFEGDNGLVVSALVENQMLALVGCGAKPSPASPRKTGKAVAEAIRSLKGKRVQLVVPEIDGAGLIVKQVILNLMKIETFLSEKKKSRPLSLRHLYISGFNDVSILDVVTGVQTTKELIAAPANFVNPPTLAAFTKHKAVEWGFECRNFGVQEASRKGMGAFLAVGQGSTKTESQFIHLVYTPTSEVRRRVVLVGKGVCHDTGGYNLKVAGGIEQMKYDMGGAAAVLGAAEAISRLKPAGVEVHFICPAVENRISSSAYLPGDIITAMNGTTIEVGNTDAEGRLILADALCYTDELLKQDDLPALVLDIATLTGACKVALGDTLAGLFASSDWAATLLLESGRKSGDRLWRMPLEEGYVERLKSSLADVNNIGGNGGGAMSAASFLQQFVDTDRVDWCHLDIAGAGYEWAENLPVGFGAHLFYVVVEALSRL